MANRWKLPTADPLAWPAPAPTMTAPKEIAPGVVRGFVSDHDDREAKHARARSVALLASIDCRASPAIECYRETTFSAQIAVGNSTANFRTRF